MKKKTLAALLLSVPALVILLLFFVIVWGNLLRYTLGIKTLKMYARSMAPALLLDDYIIVDLKYYHTDKPKNGDVISFKYPDNPSRIYVSRVIAVEGDIIESRDKVIYLNGEQITEQYVSHADNSILPYGKYRDNFGPYTIPEGKIFVMGDNRDQSFDSRYFGYVDRNEIEGKALYIYWSDDKDRIGKEIK